MTKKKADLWDALVAFCDENNITALSMTNSGEAGNVTVQQRTEDGSTSNLKLGGASLGTLLGRMSEKVS